MSNSRNTVNNETWETLNDSDKCDSVDSRDDMTHRLALVTMASCKPLTKEEYKSQGVWRERMAKNERGGLSEFSNDITMPLKTPYVPYVAGSFNLIPSHMPSWKENVYNLPYNHKWN